MIFGITEALKSLHPEAIWTVRNEKYEELEWIDENISKPSHEEIVVEINRLQSEWNALEYQRKRSLEYPDFIEYIDGIVKGDQQQIDKYISMCLEVKEKYPKNEDFS
jgi:hypothetical protein